jgi:hypothetical protein
MSKIWEALQRIEKFLDRVLIFCAVSIWAFTIAMIVIFCVKDSVPDTLIDAFFGVFGIEGVLCAVITVVKTIMSKLLDKQLGLKTGYDDEDDEYDENEIG